MNAPHGLDEIKRVYGSIRIQPDKIHGGWKIYDPIGWEAANLVIVNDLPGLPGRRLCVHKKAEAPLKAALRQWQASCPTYAIKSIGCFNPRPKRVNAMELSLHSYAVAFDINPSANPMSYPIRCDMPTEFIAAWTDNGFTWGGYFHTPDPMHFQYASGF